MPTTTTPTTPPTTTFPTTSPPPARTVVIVISASRPARLPPALTQRGDVGFNNPAGVPTFLDSLAQEPGSLIFNQFYSSNPVCSPAGLRTGRNPMRDRVDYANVAKTVKY